jgi:hypothetical protein
MQLIGVRPVEEVALRIRGVNGYLEPASRVRITMAGADEKAIWK